MTTVEASSFPSVFKEGWLRLNKKIPYLSGADGVVSKFQQKIRCASRKSIRRLHDLLLTTPAAPLRNGIFLLVAQPPLLEKRRGMDPSRKSTPFPSVSASLRL